MILNAAQQSQQHPVRPDMTIPVDGMGPPVTGGGIRDTAAMALKMPSPSISWESHQWLICPGSPRKICKSLTSLMCEWYPWVSFLVHRVARHGDMNAGSVGEQETWQCTLYRRIVVCLVPKFPVTLPFPVSPANLACGIFACPLPSLDPSVP